jgi:hypothetical protein
MLWGIIPPLGHIAPVYVICPLRLCQSCTWLKRPRISKSHTVQQLASPPCTAGPGLCPVGTAPAMGLRNAAAQKPKQMRGTAPSWVGPPEPNLPMHPTVRRPVDVHSKV